MAESDSVQGQSGRTYTIETILQDKERPLGRVYRANDGTNPVVLKEIPQNFDQRIDLYKRAGSSPNLRSILDTAPERSIFVFEYLNENLLELAYQQLPGSVMKQILKSALTGIASLHEQRIVHNDVKADNIMVQLASHASHPTVEKVQLVDLEDATYLPRGTARMGVQLGNIIWRSPEAHAMGPVQRPSDMYSFGLVCLFAMTRILPFKVDESDIPEGIEMQSVVLERHLSYFADEAGLDGFPRYLGDKSAWVPIFQAVKSTFGEGHPREPFGRWVGLGLDQEDLFKDLVCGLMNFDPIKRLTARQALEHEWFADVGIAG